MIVDRILDRKDGEQYDAKDFYNYCMKEAAIFGYYIGGEVIRAMDCRKNADVQEALCKYIMEQGYNPDICDYIRSVDWLDGLEKLNHICWCCKQLGRAEDGCHGTTEQVWTGCVYRIA